MNDLISREALINYIKAWNIGSGIAHDQNTFIGAVNAQEVVDAVEVVHGKWKRQTDYDENDNAVFECTNCMHGDIHARSAIVPFCWNCGARMDGE